MSLRLILLGVCTLTVSLLAGCTTISMAAADGAVTESLHGTPPSDPAPVTPLPSITDGPNTWKTTVTVQPGEDLAWPCNYYLYLANPAVTLRGVLVIYDRSDSRDLYADEQIRSLAGALDLGLLLAQQCDAATSEDLQQNAFAGPGRTLFTSLTQLATLTSHAELANSNVLLFGFSSAGVLAATTANYRPDRIIGVIGYDAASSYQQIDTITPTQSTLRIPYLFLSNDEDTSAGTTHDQVFLAQGWKKGAPWAWGVQHGFAHCCAESTKSVIIPWISAVVAERVSTANSLNPIVQELGVYDNYTCKPNGIWDATGKQNCRISAASLIPAGSSITGAQGWLPNAATGSAWMAWVGQ